MCCKILEITTRKRPVLGKDGNYPAWIQIPNIPGTHSRDTQRLLSVSKHSTLEIKPDNEDAFLLVFPIGRYITIIATRDNRNDTVWVTRCNDKDTKKESEPPIKNPDDDLR